MLLLCYCKRWFAFIGHYLRVVRVCLDWQKPWVYKSRGLTPRISSFLYFSCILIGQRRLYPTCISSVPDIKLEEYLWVSAWSTFIIHRYYFITGELFFGHSNLFISSPTANRSRKLFSVKILVEKIALQGRYWYQAKIKITDLL